VNDGCTRSSIQQTVTLGRIDRDDRSKEQSALATSPPPQYAPPPQAPAQYAPPPVDPADELEHLAQVHASGVLTDEEFATAKASVLGA
jgi:hypothetical protein